MNLPWSAGEMRPTRGARIVRHRSPRSPAQRWTLGRRSSCRTTLSNTKTRHPARPTFTGGALFVVKLQSVAYAELTVKGNRHVNEKCPPPVLGRALLWLIYKAKSSRAEGIACATAEFHSVILKDSFLLAC